MAPRALLACALAIVAFAPAAQAAVRVSWDAEDAIDLIERVLALPELREKATARGAFSVTILPADGPAIFLARDAAGWSTTSPARADYVVRLTTDAALVALSAESPVRALRCLVAERHVSVEPASAAERAGVRAARSRAAEGIDCHPAAHERVAEGVARVAAGPEWLLVDPYGAPLGWQDPRAPAALGATAGVSRLSAEERTALAQGVAIDRSDPWRAGASPALRAPVETALGGVCPPRCERDLVTKAGPDALASDPRVARGRP